MSKKPGREGSRKDEDVGAPTPSATPRWQVVENVVAAVEAYYSRSQADVVITKKAMLPHDDDPSRMREVDVLVRASVGRRVMRVGIDVKDEGNPLDVTKVEQLIGKASKLRKSIDRFCIVSTSGYTRTAKEDADRAGVEAFTLHDICESPDPDGWKFSRVRTIWSPVHIRLPDEQYTPLSPVAKLFDRAQVETQAILAEHEDGSLEPLAARLGPIGRRYLEANPAAGSSGGFSVRFSPGDHGWTRLKAGSQVVCVPDFFEVEYRARTVVSEFPSERRLRFLDALGVDATAATWRSGENDIQATCVKEKLGENHWRMLIEVGPARPPRTKISE